MSSFTIRDATEKDIFQIVSIWLDGQSILNKDAPLAPREHYEKFFLTLLRIIGDSPNHKFWVAVENLVCSIIILK